MRTSKVTRDVVALGTRCTAVLPLARQAQVTSRLSAYVVVAKMIIERLRVGQGLVATDPLALMAR